MVILDESDPSKHNYAFKLNYTKDNKERSIMLKAPNQNSADKWMVSVSMGILLHRLKSPQIRMSFEIEEPCDKDHEFVQLPSSVALSISTPTYPSHADDFELGIDIKREIAKKAEDGGEHLANMSELLQNEFPTPNDSPLLDRKDDVIESVAKREEIDGNMETNNIKVNGNQLRATFSNLPTSEDVVFSDNEEMLENIPDRDNADERFKNVRGILKQQESIRRAIIHRQKSNASQKEHKVATRKKIPPKTKPKPSMSTRRNASSNSFDTMKEWVVVLKENINDISMSELQTYNEQLESEKTALLNFIKVIDKNIKKKDTDDVAITTTNECTDLLLAQDRLQKVTNEINRVITQITRYVSAKLGEKVKENMIYKSGRVKHYGSAECLLSVDRKSHLYEKGYTSEPLSNEDDLRNGRRRSYNETNSIII